jgi:hypothetical protein
MFEQNLNSCLKYIREYDPLQYDDVTNVTLDLLGFRLHANTESDANDDVMTTSNEDRNSELYSPEPAETSPLIHKGNFYDSWFRSSNFLPVLTINMK